MSGFYGDPLIANNSHIYSIHLDKSMQNPNIAVCTAYKGRQEIRMARQIASPIFVSISCFHLLFCALEGPLIAFEE